MQSPTLATCVSWRRSMQALVMCAALFACSDVVQPTRPPAGRSTAIASRPSPAVAGQYAGTVYYALCNLNLQGNVFRVSPNGGTAAGIYPGIAVRASSQTRRLAIRDDRSSGPIVTTDTAGGHVRNLGSFGVGGRMFSWSPDGKKVAAFYADASTPLEIIVLDDDDNFGFVEVPYSGGGNPTAFDWRGAQWVIGKTITLTPPTGFFNTQGRVAAVASAPGSTAFGNLWTPTFVAHADGLWSPSVDGVVRTDASGVNNFFANVNGGVRIAPWGAVSWAGIDYNTNQRGIYTGTGTFYINSGQTGDFAFSPDGQAVAAIRMSNNGDGSVQYNLDIIDLASGAYVRTLATSSALGASGLMLCSVDWMGEAPVGTPPVAAITFSPTGTANEFQFDGSGSIATTAGATIQDYQWTFSDGATMTGATVTHRFTTTTGTPSATLKVTDSNGLESTASVTLSAHLTINTVFLTPEEPSIGNPFSMAVHVTNDGGVAVSNVAASATFSPSAAVTVQQVDTPVSLEPGTAHTFTIQALANAAGNITSLVNAAGTATGAPVQAAQRTRTFTIAGAGISVSLSANPETPEAGTDFTVTAQLTNNGAIALTGVAAALAAVPTTDLTMGTPVPVTIAKLAAGASANVSWTLRRTSSGAIALRADASGREDNQAATQRTGSGTLNVTVADHRLIVTTAGDGALAAQQLADRICDVSPAVAGNQCTLRAAIQLANALGGSQSITFNIEGGGVPSIAPTGALPAITTPTTIDGTSQAGGWVELNGQFAGEASGLLVNAGPTTIRGLVINRWAVSGILLQGGAGNVVAGNRIGTDASGTAPRPNRDGVFVDAGTVTVGGVVGTSAAACAGDCNLISANHRNAVHFAHRGGGAMTGNWVGVDATGVTALPNSDDSNSEGAVVVEDELESPSGVTPPVVIGGATTRPGLAPGNLISGNAKSGIAIHQRGNVHISGNLIGLDRTGTRMLSSVAGPGPTESGAGVAFFDGNRMVTDVVVGGPAGFGNVIGGFSYAGVRLELLTGVEDSGPRTVVLVEGNRIGTNVDGTAPVPNQRGVFHEGLGGESIVKGNLVSGNISFGILGANLSVGNRVGTDVTGTRAIPNGWGISGGRVGGVRPAGSTSCDDPCNLISGNSREAIDGATIVQGNFIGTDVTGTVALPNGGGGFPLDPGVRPILDEVTHVGGESSALNGTCDRACNLIAGNANDAIVLDMSTVESPLEVYGNFVGLGIDRHPLPNGGRAIVVTNSAKAPRIGGDGALGNVIAYNAGAAIAITSVQAGLLIRGNAIAHNGEGIAYANGLTVRVPPLPVVEEVVRSGATTTIRGSVIGASGSARVDIYASEGCDVGQQGHLPLGFVQLGAVNTASWNADIKDIPASMTFIVATTTHDGVTSPFSKCHEIAGSKVAEAAPAGTIELPVTSNAPFTIGGWAAINPGAPNAEHKKIGAFGSLIFTTPLAYNHAAGEPVVPALAPEPAGWLLGGGADLAAFGDATPLTLGRLQQVVAGDATRTGRGVWALSRTGVVVAAGDAAVVGDASASLDKQERAVAIMGSASGVGYLIVTDAGRVLGFGDAASLGDLTTAAAARAATGSSREVAAAAAAPGGTGYALVTTCGEVFSFGTLTVGGLSAGTTKCDVVGAAVPMSGTGLWVLHADGRVDALGGAPSLGGLQGRFSAPAGIIAGGDGYVVVESNGTLHGFGTATPKPVPFKGQVAGMILRWR